MKQELNISHLFSFLCNVTGLITETGGYQIISVGADEVV